MNILFKRFALCSLLFALCNGSAIAQDLWDEEPLSGDSYNSGRGSSSQQWNFENERDRILLDTEDPLFMLKTGYVLSQTSLMFNNHSLAQLGQALAVGINNHLSIFADIKYQHDFDGPRYGFSGPGLGGIYRILRQDILLDLFAGLQFAGRERIPEFANNIYYIGTRVGKQWKWITLAGTASANWIFDEDKGHAYIDLIPEAYFRITSEWSAGFLGGIRTSTTPSFNQEWLGAKVSKRYGRTMYTGQVEYEFEYDEWRFTARLNLLF
ncbi:MAG: hypothetical protein FWG18_01025 [Alphaproteobacteria bacterium]|nr:hypothetical protein [Alphaproteobacteria bacterium]